ncbi:hypothetical protein [Pseudoalteromonas xiamenensis]|uniref:Uncharacterized protein n=1 Tax=Pseudoalteromonas xiamenensis TaxID=882626 RepID=A0A975DJV9_9GAMM|nr:hypothetical protein [Pseudoalteromonas xiamenensis]QTH72989.1 hypothetical protein J5O05_17685 [Pseudoalteromonas xiamenensis]
MNILNAHSTFFHSINKYRSVQQPSPQQAKADSSNATIERLSGSYNLRSMTVTERIEFANSAISNGDLSLKEAGTILPINDLKRVDAGNAVEIQHVPQPHLKYDVIQELESSIAFQKQFGDQKGIEIKEITLAKLLHLYEGKRISLTV